MVWAKSPLGCSTSWRLRNGAFLAQIGQLVLVAGQGEQDAGLTEQVERDVGQGDLLLQDRGVAGPLAQPVGEDQGVVPEGAGPGWR